MDSSHHLHKSRTFFNIRQSGTRDHMTPLSPKEVLDPFSIHIIEELFKIAPENPVSINIEPRTWSAPETQIGIKQNPSKMGGITI